MKSLNARGIVGYIWHWFYLTLGPSVGENIFRFIYVLNSQCCTYDDGEKEQRAMDIARERSSTGKFPKKNQIIRPCATNSNVLYFFEYV
ncbi:hypothetical protein L2E82_15707 [Cichorium intybus]|uniref:Uncharacterized protein n=1 Tax=Cichorium intybus TaxID=13427 RepID=A0ACB9F437_CICIN|nr:hypothetical protein L2E82_15707 [Cichorium intybus]